MKRNRQTKVDFSQIFHLLQKKRLSGFQKSIPIRASRNTYPTGGRTWSNKVLNFGQNLYQWFLSNAQSLVLMAIVVIGIYLGFKREFSKLIGFLVVALIAVGLVFNAAGVKDVLLELFNKIIGA